MKKRILAPLFAVLIAGSQPAFAQDFGKDLEGYIETLISESEEIADERKEMLREIGDFMVRELEEDGKADMIIICTHNSRRSHISQAWLQTASIYYGINGVNVFSGGLEATAFNPNAISALERAGFGISGTGKSDANPKYTVAAGNYRSIHYSKKYTDQQNPKEDFGAVMVCSDADESYPIVKGADGRFALPFEDPRYYDDTPSQDMKYDETVRLIGREMFYLADYVKDQLNRKMEAKKG